ncbi:MAG TPA: response regulator transcription factor [Acidimicrobiales bacterium]|nr:response regulator transcription factor [Acidimicrobiales bacterium]
MNRSLQTDDRAAVRTVAVAETAVAIVDHQPVLCESLSVCLSSEPDLRVVGSTSTRSQLGGLVATARPDVLVYDSEFDGSDSLRTLRGVLSMPSPPAIVMLIGDGAVMSGASAIEEGVLGLVLKVAPVKELVDAVRLAAKGQMWVSPPLLTGLLSVRLGTGRRGAKDRLSALTRRELQVLDLLVEGLGHRAIAQRLQVSANTVRTHSQNLQRKLDVHSALAAVAIALEAGIRPA